MPSDPAIANPEQFFHCTQCGECCRGFGGTYVSDADIIAIADYLELPADDVRRRYCTPSGSKVVLAQRSDGFCAFFENNCTIHSVKPLMCRRWPFIPSLLVDVANWQIMAANCPGINAEADPEALLNFVKTYLDNSKPAGG